MPARGREAGAKPLSGADTRSSDVDIRNSVIEALEAERWADADRVNVVVNEGVVHVWGVVRSEDRRRALLIAVRGVPGVTAAVDHLSPDWFANDAG